MIREVLIAAVTRVLRTASAATWIATLQHDPYDGGHVDLALHTACGHTWSVALLAS